MLATGIVKVENISLNVQKKTGNQKGHLHVFNMSTGKGYKVSSLWCIHEFAITVIFIDTTHFDNEISISFCKRNEC